MEVYVGLQPDGPYRASNSPGDVVERLCSQILQTGRNITIVKLTLTLSNLILIEQESRLLI